MVKSARAKRMAKHHKRNKGAGSLNLVSLMDIFTILVFFQFAILRRPLPNPAPSESHRGPAPTIRGAGRTARAA